MKRFSVLLPPVLAVFLVLAVPAMPARAKGGAVSYHDYRTLLHDCRVFASGREYDPADAKGLARRLRGVSAVTLPSGQKVSVDTEPEAVALDAITATTPDKKLADRFDALGEQVTTNPGRPANPTDPHERAVRILARSEFASSQPPHEDKGWNLRWLPRSLMPLGRWLEKVFAPLGRWVSQGLAALGRGFSKFFQNFFRAIGKFFRWLGRSLPTAKVNPKNPFAGSANTLLLTLCFLATVAAVVGLYYLARYLFGAAQIRAGRKRAAATLGGDLDLASEGITDPLGTARTRAAQGDYRAAVRLTYIAALWKLGENGYLTLEKNRTNWEYQRALRSRSRGVHDDLLPATRLFDRVWYGNAAATQAEFESVDAIYQKLPAAFREPTDLDSADSLAASGGGTPPAASGGTTV